MPFLRPCLDCGTLTDKGNRCHPHQTQYQARLDARKDRQHYKGNYARRARYVRATTTHCWICKEGPRPNDPWTADHYYPKDPTSPLLGAHRSCNSRRGNKPPE